MTVKTNVDMEHDLALGQTYLVLRNGVEHEAELVERRASNDPAAGCDDMEYFVHYKTLNRRLDEWVSPDRILPLPPSQPQRIVSRKSTTHLPRASTSSASLSRSTVDGANPHDTSPIKRTRHQKRVHNEINHVQMSYEEMDPTTAALEKEHEMLTRVKYIKQITMGAYDIDTWYYSPYPEDYGKAAKLYICEYCCKYMMHEETYRMHLDACTWRQPPGIEIYRDGSLSVYEVDGSEFKVYCQCLCLLAKLFLDHKTLYFDVEPFLFYVLTEVDDYGAHIVGYFSKEKYSVEGNNLACIMTMPPFQRKGYGKFLIQLSYEMSHREGVIGSPEKPLSDLGKLSYRSYWSWRIVQVLKTVKQSIGVTELSQLCGLSHADIESSMGAMNLTKFWKGQTIICVSQKILDDASAVAKAPKLILNNDKLVWQPPLEVDQPTKSHGKKLKR